VVEKVLRLARRKEKYLVVAAVRFLRTCIALKVCSWPLFLLILLTSFFKFFEMAFYFREDYIMKLLELMKSKN
jgi:hypothetical protein